MSDNNEFDEDFEDDGFLDEEAGDLEDFLDEEDLDDPHEDNEWDDAEYDNGKLTATPKKKLSFNTIVIVVGVVAALGVFGMQIIKGGGDKQGKAAAVTEAPVKGIGMTGARGNIIFQDPSKKEGLEKADSSEDSTPSGSPGLLDELGSSSDLPKYQPRRKVPEEVDNPPQPKPFSRQEQLPENAAAKTGPLTPLPDTGADEFLPSLSAVSSPEQQDPAVPAEPQIPEMPAVKSVMDPVVLEESTGGAEEPASKQEGSLADTAVILEKLDEISSRLDAFEDRLDGMDERMSSGGKDDSAYASEIEALKKSLSRLEKKQTSIQKSAAARPAPAAPAPSAAAVYKAPPEWELRAAQPGRAWVSRKGSSEMQMIEVGDSLEGIGKIISISYDGGIWVILGSRGKISQ